MIEAGLATLSTLNWASAGISFASNFLGAMGNANKLKRDARMYQEQAKVYRRNAALTRRNGSLNEDISRSQQRMAIASARAAAGEAGVSESPTANLALATSYGILEQNILNDRFRVESEAANYLYEARVAEENARVLRKSAKNSFRNSIISGSLSALTMAI